MTVGVFWLLVLIHGAVTREKKNYLDGISNFLHAYADSDWATCVKTHRSFGGTCIRLVGGSIAYKSKFQPTVAGSSMEADFMAAYSTGKRILFVCSILWDLDIL